MQRVWLSILVVGVAGSFNAACGKKAADTASENVVETAIRTSGGDADVSIEDETMKITTADGTMSMGEGAKLPADWPEDAPVYKGLQLTMSLKSGNSSSVQGTTSDSMDKVVAFYKDAAEKGGWTEASAMTQPQMTMLNYTKENRNLSVMVTEQDSVTALTLSISSQ